MRIDFMDISTGEVVASSEALTVRNGKLVPDSLGLPVLTPTDDYDDYDDVECADDCGWCRHRCWS